MHVVCGLTTGVTQQILIILLVIYCCIETYPSMYTHLPLLMKMLLLARSQKGRYLPPSKADSELSLLSTVPPHPKQILDIISFYNTS